MHGGTLNFGLFVSFRQEIFIFLLLWRTHFSLMGG